MACVLNGVSRERCRGLVCGWSGDEREGGPEPGRQFCVRAEDGVFWLILCFILYLYFFILFLFEAFQLFHRSLNEATNRKTPVYNGANCRMGLLHSVLITVDQG